MQFDEKLTKELIFKNEILRVEAYENSSGRPFGGFHCHVNSLFPQKVFRSSSEKSLL